MTKQISLAEACACEKEPPPRVRSRCTICGRVSGSARPLHPCHAEACHVEVPPKMLMCARHWKMVPRPLQARVWAAYVPGQERRKDPTPEYLDAHRAAVEAVAEAEGRRR